MSGPKVVNIQALRRQQQRDSSTCLAELHVAIEECLRLQNDHQETESEFRKNTEVILTRLNGLRDSEQWSELLAETMSYRDFYQLEAANFRLQSAERRAVAFRREHRLRQNAVQIVETMRQLPPSSERDSVLQGISAAKTDDDALARAIAEATDFVIKTRQSDATTEHATRLKKLAALYVDSEIVEETASLPSVEEDANEQRLDRCWSLLGELAGQAPIAQIEMWKQKAHSIATTTSNERVLLLDSLALELTTHVRNQRTFQASQSAVAAALSEIAHISSPEAEVWRNKLQSALHQPIHAEESQALVTSALAWIKDMNAREDASEQRTAILRILGELGYEVREGMVTAWSEQGRIIVHKPNEPLYGVEFSAPAKGDAFQARVVAVGEKQRSTQRDREIEETWCNEFAHLRELLSDEGFQTNLAQAHEPGAIPIKTVTGNDSSADRSRTLRPVARQNS